MHRKKNFEGYSIYLRWQKSGSASMTSYSDGEVINQHACLLYIKIQSTRRNIRSDCTEYILEYNL